MGRKPLTPPDVIDVVVDEQRLGDAMTAMRQEGQALVVADQQHVAAVRAVAAQVGYQLPGDCADPDMIQRDIAANMRRTAEAMFQVGLGLICLKEACHHGEFMARLEVLRFEPRAAQRYMQVARRLSNASTSTHLLKVVESQSKLLELIVLDDEQIEELELTGQTGELKLDDVATMSVKELRKAVRELKGEVTAKEDVLSTRSRQINELEEKLARVKTVPPDEVLADLHKATTAHFNDARGALIGKFRAGVEAIDQHHQAVGGDSLAFVAGLIGQLQADLAQIRDSFGIPDVAPALVPEWVTDPSFGHQG
jgi:ribosomal protein L29